MEAVQPRGVVILGGTAGKAVYEPAYKVGERRGRLLEWPADGHLARRPEWALAAVHPSAVLRSRERDEMYAGFVADLRLAAETLGRAAADR